MKAVLVLLVAVVGSVYAGDGGVSPSPVAPQTLVRRISPEVLQGIKDLAVFNNPGSPREQVDAVTEGVEAYFALKRIPNNPAKHQAAVQFPYDFPKQLFLAQRGYLALRSTGGVPPRYW